MVGFRSGRCRADTSRARSAGSRCGMGRVGVGPFDVESRGWAVHGVADAALEAGVGLRATFQAA